MLCINRGKLCFHDVYIRKAFSKNSVSLGDLAPFLRIHRQESRKDPLRPTDTMGSATELPNQWALSIVDLAASVSHQNVYVKKI